MADKPIVVGVDGSPSSMKDLRWAIRQAKLTGAEVEAVTAWSYPSGYGWTPFGDGAVDLEGGPVPDSGHYPRGVPHECERRPAPGLWSLSGRLTAG